MSIAKVIEISSSSDESFDEAIRAGIAKAGESVHNIKSAWVKEQQVRVKDDEVVSYQVNLLVTFVVD
ncbi:dodecin domain-containing protein [bacterium]|nr:dodecin domain-containing protein [bacterium]